MELSSLGYLQGFNPAPDKNGVVLYHKDLAFPGFNLYTSGSGPEAFLIDMNGRVLHKWHFPAQNIFPEAQSDLQDYFMRVHLCDNGDLMILFIHLGLIKIDKDSNLLWVYPCRAHHDFNLDSQGNIYLLTEKNIEIEGKKHIRDNQIVVLKPDRTLTKELSLFELLKKSPYFDSVFFEILNFIKEMDGKFKKDNRSIENYNVFHLNTLEVFDGRLASKSPLFKKGNVMVDSCTLGFIAIIDIEKEEIVWLKGPGIWHEGLYNVVLLNNGNILLFDNYYTQESSRVIEFDLLTSQVVWDYKGDKNNSFFTYDNGTNQRLSNGNTLITETDNGRVFEVTKDKKIVWEFLNPYQAGKNKELIAVIHEMERLPSDFPLQWIRKDPQ